MAMRLLRATEVPATPRDRVFRSSPLYGVLFVLACFGLCAGMIVSRWPGPRLAYYLSATILIFLLLMHKLVVARFSPSNWLVRVADDGLFIHFRSYLNDHLSAEDPTVVFLPYPDIRSVRLIRERLQTLDSDGARSVQTRRLVELALAIDPAPLAAALATECVRSAAWERRWYGRSATLYNDYPVIMQSPLSCAWNGKLRPGLRSFSTACGNACRSRLPSRYRKTLPTCRDYPASAKNSACGNSTSAVTRLTRFTWHEDSTVWT